MNQPRLNLGERVTSSLGLFLLGVLFLISNTLPGSSASEVRTSWRYTNMFIIIIIIIIIIKVGCRKE